MTVWFFPAEVSFKVVAVEKLKKVDRHEPYRLQQMRDVGYWMGGPIAIILVLQAHFTDRQLYPGLWDASWVWIRMGIIPVGLLCMGLYKTQFGKKWPEVPVSLVAVYIVCIHLFLMYKSGGVSTKYSHAFVQTILGIALLPTTTTWFWGLTGFILSSYFAMASHYGHEPLKYFLHGEDPWLRVYLSMGILFFYSISLARQRGYHLRTQLEDELENRKKAIDQLVTSQLKFQEERAVGQLAAQVAHDIRSPLTALSVLSDNLEGMPESHRVLLRGSVERLRDIANLLLLRYRTESKKEGDALSEQTSLTPQLLSHLVEMLVSEKRVQYRSRLNLEIQTGLTPASYGLFSKVDPSEFRRVLSNLVDNSVEAIEEQGWVKLSLSMENEGILLTITDSGCGIPDEILPSLFRKGATFGKKAGSGLGLFHARTSIEKLGGSIAISSEEKGTVCRIWLPRCEAPKWFIPRLDLKHYSKIVILDDDSSIHSIWKDRFTAMKASPVLHHFSSPVALEKWFREHQPGNDVLYLIDFELLGFASNGLDLVFSLGLGPQAVLVTSRFEDEKILSACLEKNISLLPKSMSSVIPIV